MKLFCSEKHWSIKDGQILLHSNNPKHLEAQKKLIQTLENQIRERIYNQICDIDLTSNRKQIMKYGLENALLTVQDLIANAVLKGNKNE